MKLLVFWCENNHTTRQICFLEKNLKSMFNLSPWQVCGDRPKVLSSLVLSLNFKCVSQTLTL